MRATYDLVQVFQRAEQPFFLKQNQVEQSILIVC